MRQAITFHVYRSADSNPKQAWRWRAIARNGRIVADSGEGYSSKAAAVKSVDRLTSHLWAHQWEMVVSE